MDESIPAEILIRFLKYLDYQKIIDIIIRLTHWKSFCHISLWEEKCEYLLDYFDRDHEKLFKAIEITNFPIYIIYFFKHCSISAIDMNYHLLYASRRGNEISVKVILRELLWIEAKIQTDTILQALDRNFLDIVKLILSDKKFKPGKRELYEITQKSCELGYDDIIELILSDDRFIVTRKNKPFVTACKSGYTRIVELYLKDGRCNPSQNNSKALYLSCKYGHTKIVKILLQYNVRCNYNDCKTLYEACKHGHTEIVKLLLKQESIWFYFSKPESAFFFDYKYRSFFAALQKDYTEIYKLFLNDNRINIYDLLYGSLYLYFDKFLIIYNHRRITKDITGRIFIAACDVCRLDVVKYLIKYQDVTGYKEKALQCVNERIKISINRAMLYKELITYIEKI